MLGPRTLGHSQEVPLLAQPDPSTSQLQPEREGTVHRAGDQKGLAQVAMDPGWHADNWGACRQKGIQNLLLFAPNLGPVLGFDPQRLG